MLLSVNEERVLSALPDDRATTIRKIAAKTHMDREKIRPLITKFVELKLISCNETKNYGELISLTGIGSEHWQRRQDQPRAGSAPLPVRSERVREVLTYLSQKGPTRTRDVGIGLGISRSSMNALMQYLKRKDLVYKLDVNLHAPHDVTDYGRKTLAEMNSSPGDLLSPGQTHEGL
jgi:DNA-binding MarR family transcriptional regulator